MPVPCGSTSGVGSLHGHAPPSPDTLARELLCWNVLWGGASNVIARRELLQTLGGFDEQFFQLADWDLWIRLALSAPAAAVEDVLVALVVHPQSMLLVDSRDVFVEFERLAAKHRDAAARAGVAFDRARFARWVAAGHLRAGRRRAAARAYVTGTSASGNMLRAAGAFLGPTLFARVSALRRYVPGALGAGERVASRPKLARALPMRPYATATSQLDGETLVRPERRLDPTEEQRVGGRHHRLVPAGEPEAEAGRSPPPSRPGRRPCRAGRRSRRAVSQPTPPARGGPR